MPRSVSTKTVSTPAPSRSDKLRIQFDQLSDGVLLTGDELAGVLGVKLNTMKDWRQRGIGPVATRLGGRSIRYAVSDVRAWIAAQREDS